ARRVYSVRQSNQSAPAAQFRGRCIGEHVFDYAFECVVIRSALTRADMLNSSAQRIAVVSQVALYADGCAPVCVVVFSILKGQDSNAVAGPQRFDEGIGSAANELDLFAR